MWSDKYKPHQLDSLLINQQLQTKLSNFVKTKNIPNMIVSGEIGCGKSCVLMCMARELYKRDISTYLCHLNSSIEKNIRALREQLEQFCRMKTPEEKIFHKMFIFDDVDLIPKKVQLTIANIMEKFQNIYYMFTCVNTSDICETIQSRCVIFRIDNPSEEELISRLKLICMSEHVRYTDKALQRICFLAQNDVRLAINTLQSICTGFNLVTIENIDNICDTPNPIYIQKIIDDCMNNRIEIALKHSIELHDDGYTSLDILSCMFDVLRTYKVSDTLKIPMMKIIGKTLYKINRKIDSMTQLEKCIIKMCMQIHANT